MFMWDNSVHGYHTFFMIVNRMCCEYIWTDQCLQMRISYQIGSRCRLDMLQKLSEISFELKEVNNYNLSSGVCKYY